jgi:hypothetical protein
MEKSIEIYNKQCKKNNLKKIKIVYIDYQGQAEIYIDSTSPCFNCDRTNKCRLYNEIYKCKTEQDLELLNKEKTSIKNIIKDVLSPITTICSSIIKFFI